MSEYITIDIEGKPFTYLSEEGDFTQKSLKAISRDDAVYTLTITKKLLDQAGIHFCLAFGTLLGAIRENDIIKGDEDVDIYTTQENELYRLLPWFYDNGLKVIRIRKGVLYSFRVNKGCFIDIYILRPLSFSIWSFYCLSLEGKATPKRFVQETQNVAFLGEEYFCPKNPERILEWWYGKSWRIPQASKGRYEVYSRIIWKKIIYYFKHLPGYLKKKFA